MDDDEFSDPNFNENEELQRNTKGVARNISTIWRLGHWGTEVKAKMEDHPSESKNHS